MDNIASSSSSFISSRSSALSFGVPYISEDEELSCLEQMADSMGACLAEKAQLFKDRGGEVTTHVVYGGWSFLFSIGHPPTFADGSLVSFVRASSRRKLEESFASSSFLTNRSCCILDPRSRQLPSRYRVRPFNLSSSFAPSLKQPCSIIIGRRKLGRSVCEKLKEEEHTLTQNCDAVRWQRYVSSGSVSQVRHLCSRLFT